MASTPRAASYRKGSWSPAALLTIPPSSSHTEQFRKRILSRIFELSNLDRVNVLGDDGRYGHTGCVNALSWAQDGNILLSGGDDTTIRMWRLDTSNTAHEYPFVCNSVIRSGHSANIFSVQMLPHSSRIATAAGDTQVRVFDVKTAVENAVPDRLENEYSVKQACIRILRCHEERVKRIITEDSPDLFLSVSEDGTVRQHDLRTFHNCRAEACPAPLVQTEHSLSTLAISPLTPHQFVVAGDGPYGYLYDRRHLRRIIESEWGAIPRAGQEATTCVRKFGRLVVTERTSPRRDHITGARMSRSNGHEVILSYSGDGIYMFSTHDEPEIKEDASSSLPSTPQESASSGARDADIDEFTTLEESSLSSLDAASTHGPNVPIIRPRRRYTGARNVATVKDVNFLGPNDDSVTSGSDDGNFFIWDKHDGRLQGIYEGDSSVVNIIEGHPYFPLVAVSGIDTTVKLFGPTYTRSWFSRVENVEQILETNTRLNNTPTALGALLVRSRLGAEFDRDLQCIGQ